MTKRSYPFGYCCEKGEITINEKEGEVVKRIFEEYAEGRSLKEIADRLNEQGIAFKTAVSPWHKSRVHHLLTDGRYIGEKNYPPLIERELFERNARLRENKYGETEPVSEGYQVFAEECRVRCMRQPLCEETWEKGRQVLGLRSAWLRESACGKPFVVCHRDDHRESCK